MSEGDMKRYGPDETVVIKANSHWQDTDFDDCILQIERNLHDVSFTNCMFRGRASVAIQTQMGNAITFDECGFRRAGAKQ